MASQRRSLEGIDSIAQRDGDRATDALESYTRSHKCGGHSCRRPTSIFIIASYFANLLVACSRVDVLDLVSCLVRRVKLMHANSGVEKGMAAGGKPVEIMGMMLGRPDTETPNALIVTDVSSCEGVSALARLALFGSRLCVPHRLVDASLAYLTSSGIVAAAADIIFRNLTGGAQLGTGTCLR